MVEEKVEEMKLSLDNKDTKKSEQKTITHTRPVHIDLNIEVALPDELFATSLDKINFYREVETIANLEDLKIISEDFLHEPEQTTLNFF